MVRLCARIIKSCFVPFVAFFIISYMPLYCYKLTKSCADPSCGFHIIQFQTCHIYVAMTLTACLQTCQICCCDDNEAELLLCDNCDKGYHTYCFKVSDSVTTMSLQSAANHGH